MSHMVSMRDYEGFGGFGMATQSDVDELNKALSAGYQSPRHDGGSALRVESLENTMRVLTFTQQHIKLWREIPKLPAYSTSEEYNVQTSYGQDNGVFTREGATPQTQDASYGRRIALIKYLGTQREVTHPMTLVRPAHGSAIALETQNGAIWLLERLERALFFGDSSVIPEAFDGLVKQLTQDLIQPEPNTLDLRGGVLGEAEIEEAANRVVTGYGVPGALHLAPRALSDLAKEFYPRERYNLPAPADGRVGMAVSSVMTQAGEVRLKNNMFLRSGDNNGVKTAPSAATARRAPNAATVVGALNAGPIAGSLFTAADVGTFQYKVTAINRFGQSAAAQEAGGVAIAAAGDAITLTITDGGGADQATGYRVWRSVVGGAVGTEQLIAEVPRVPGAATTAWQDLNLYLPNTSKAFMLQMNLQSLAFKQLAPMMKIPLATLAASIRWMQLLYGTLVVYAPDRNFMFTNVKDS